ncbi:MAG TPA: tetraacyldisaccharide 4'-kinase [Longimicrobiales bacterium]|nr:tetraacyldisaccharide 4'-kinase [Longimicrobiales bacterium]
MSRRMEDLARRWWGGELGAAGVALDVALAPAEAAYRLGTLLRNHAYDRGMLTSEKAPLPVISVGNIAVGGTGKTPFTSWLARRLEARGEVPAIVHGGYAADEPELHRSWTPHIPVVVDRNRARAVERAHAAGATVAVLDDAFQHRRLRRDLDIVLISVERWSGAARLLPRGAWREPPAALRRAGLVVCVRKTAVEAESAELASAIGRATGQAVMRVYLHASAWRQGDAPSSAPPEQCVIAVGLADHGLFVANARAAGAAVGAELIFPDHHEYDAADVDRIRAAAAGRPVVTSAKDWVKLRGRMDAAQTWVLTQELVVEDGGALLDAAVDGALE